jgi:hypothetical protein
MRPSFHRRCSQIRNLVLSRPVAFRLQMKAHTIQHGQTQPFNVLRISTLYVP